MFKMREMKEFNSYMCNEYKFLLTPLNFLNIKYFGYRKFLLNSKTSFGFCTASQWLRVIDKISRGCIFSPYNYELKKVLDSEDQYFWRIGTPEKRKYYEILYEEDLWNTFVLYQKQKDFIEGFYFILPELNEKMDFLLKNFGAFQRFVYYFQNKTNHLKDYDNYSDLIRFNVGEPGLSPKKNIMSNFLDNTPINNISIEIQNQVIAITRREAECLDLFSKGKTSKEIARSLNISPRTVEQYVTNLKNKSGINSKSNLIDIFRKVKVGKQFFQ